MQRRYEQARSTHIAEIQRTVESDKRTTLEKARRGKQERDRLRLQQLAASTSAAQQFAAQHTKELLTDVFNGLVDDGHFYDPLTREVRSVGCTV